MKNITYYTSVVLLITVFGIGCKDAKKEKQYVWTTGKADTTKLVIKDGDTTSKDSLVGTVTKYGDTILAVGTNTSNVVDIERVRRERARKARNKMFIAQDSIKAAGN